MARPAALAAAVAAALIGGAGAQTAATAVSSISPYSISLATPTVITFGGAGAGDTAEFIGTIGDCSTAAATPSIDISSGSATITMNSLGTYDLCVQSSGQTDSVKQTSISLTVVAGTPASVITSINYHTITISMDHNINLYGTYQLGDFAIFAPIGTCASATPNIDATSGVIIVNLGATGQYDLCYRQTGRSDSVKQTGITLWVAAASVAGSDPIAVFGDVRREFRLPPGQMTELLRGPDLVLSGSTFEGGGPWEQWFDRFRVSTPDGRRWLELSMRKDLATYNRSAAPRNAFETIVVRMGGAGSGDPSDVVMVPGHGAAIPFSFLGADVVFRQIHRHHNTRFPTIGGLRRECMDYAGGSLHFYICSGAANEYHGLQRYLAIQYAHLDFAIQEVREMQAVEGLLPELWGLRPMSEKTASYVVEESEEARHHRLADAALVADASTTPLPSSAAWAGGELPEDLERGCASDQEQEQQHRQRLVNV